MGGTRRHESCSGSVEFSTSSTSRFSSRDQHQFSCTTDSLSPFSAQRGARLQGYKVAGEPLEALRYSGIICTNQQPTCGLGICLPRGEPWQSPAAKSLKLLGFSQMDTGRGVEHRHGQTAHLPRNRVLRERRAVAK